MTLPGFGQSDLDAHSREELLALVKRQQATIAQKDALIALQQAQLVQQVDSASPLGGRAFSRRGATPDAAPNHATANASGSAFTIVFDGGSLGNPGKGYGSFQIGGEGGVVAHEKLDFGDRVTNNQAEYQTLIGALERLAVLLEDRAKTATVTINGDSSLVINQVTGRWKVKHPELQPLHRRAVALLGQFGKTDLHWHGRAASVRVLGH